MQIIVAVVAFAVVLALASANVATQAKKVKAGPGGVAAAGNAYLNVWFYGTSTCSGDAGLAVSVPNKSCWTNDCPNRRELKAADAVKVSSKAAAALHKVFPKGTVSDASRTKLQADGAISLGFVQTTIGNDAVGAAFAAAFTDLTCSTWEHDDATASYSAEPVTGFYPVNTCINGDSGYPFKVSFTSQPAVPMSANGHVALSGFNNEAQCASGKFGNSSNTAANGLDVHFFYPINACNFQGEVATVTDGVVSVTEYENQDCTGSDTTNVYGPVATCAFNTIDVSELGPRCGSLRLDVVAPQKATAKKTSVKKVAASLRV